MYKCGVARERFVEPGGDASAALERVEAALDEIALAVELLVEPSLLRSLWSRGNDGFDISGFQPVENLVGVVGSVGQTESAGEIVEEVLCYWCFVALPRSEMNVQGTSFEVGDEVDLCGESAPGAAYRVFFGPPRPPLAS